MEIKRIKVTDAAAVGAWLKKAEGRSSARTISAEEVAELADRVGSKLTNLGIPQRLWDGLVVTFRVAGPGSSYRERARGTQVQIVRLSRQWYFLSAERVPVYAGCGEKLTLEFPEASADEVKTTLAEKSGLSFKVA